MIETAAAERAKYEQVWEAPEYRRYSPGEAMAWPFIRIARPKGSIIDFGCGPGRASLMFHLFGLDVTMIDTAVNCLDDEIVQEIGARFVQGNLWDSDLPIPVADYGYCVDVMEHIPPEWVGAVIANILRHAQTTFFHICLRKDHFGEALIGHPLHLTVKPFAWWRDLLGAHGEIIDGRDLIDNGLFIVRSRAVRASRRH